jgi:hypothetical protein
MSRGRSLDLNRYDKNEDISRAIASLPLQTTVTLSNGYVVKRGWRSIGDSSHTDVSSDVKLYDLLTVKRLYSNERRRRIKCREGWKYYGGRDPTLEFRRADLFSDFEGCEQALLCPYEEREGEWDVEGDWCIIKDYADTTNREPFASCIVAESGIYHVTCKELSNVNVSAESMRVRIMNNVRQMLLNWTDQRGNGEEIEN